MAAVKTPRWIRITRRREFVRRQIRRSRFEVVDETYTNDGFGTMSYRFRLVAGIIVELPEIGWLKLWRDHPELPLSEAEYLRYDRLRRLLAPLLSPYNRPAAQRPELACPNHGLDANGYLIPLPGTDAILAMAPPPGPPRVYENPKTLRHIRTG
jgi:hypothetical protein